MRPNKEVILNCLLAGVPIELRGMKLKMIPVGDDIIAPSGIYGADHPVLVHVLLRTGGKTDEVHMPCELSFNTVMQLIEEKASTLTEEERVGMIATKVITEVNSEKRRPRSV